MPNLFAFIQARSNSFRFPNKIFQFLDFKKQTVLDEVIDRACQVLSKDKIIVLIPENDKPLIHFLSQKEILYFEGSEKNVLDRFQKAAEFFKADYILRLTSDNPFIDLFYLDCLIQSYLSYPVDLATIQGLPIGMVGEIIKASALYSRKATLAHHQEHVTLHIKENIELFQVYRLKPILQSSLSTLTNNNIRLTLDEEKDLTVLQKIFNQLASKNRYFGYPEIYNLFQQQKKLFTINQKVTQITFSLPQYRTVKIKNRVLIICGDPRDYGSGHFQRMKYLAYMLQFHDIDCNLQYELPSDYLSYDLVIFDKRNCLIPPSLTKVLLLDHFGTERNDYPYHDLLLHTNNQKEFSIEQVLIPPLLTHYPKKTKNKQITVYAGNVSEPIFYLDSYLTTHFPEYKIFRIGGKKPNLPAIEHKHYVVNSQFYYLLSQASIFVSYYGQSLMEGIFLQKKVLQFSISTQHHKLSQLLEQKYNISYIGSLNRLQEKDFSKTQTMSLLNKGYQKLISKILRTLQSKVQET